MLQVPIRIDGVLESGGCLLERMLECSSFIANNHICPGAAAEHPGHTTKGQVIHMHLAEFKLATESIQLFAWFASVISNNITSQGEYLCH